MTSASIVVKQNIKIEQTAKPKTISAHVGKVATLIAFVSHKEEKNGEEESKKWLSYQQYLQTHPTRSLDLV